MAKLFLRLCVLAGLATAPGCATVEDTDIGLSITGRIHFNINVSEFAPSREFYAALGFTDSVGGFPETNTLEVSQAVGFKGLYRLNAELAYFGTLPDGEVDLTIPTGRFIDLVEWLEPRRSEQPYSSVNHLGMARFALTTTDVDADYAYFNARGVTFISPPATRDDGSRFVIAFDPDGTFIELNQDDTTTNRQGVSEQQHHITGVKHVNVNVSDFDKSKQFYEMLGFEEAKVLSATDNLAVAQAMGFSERFQRRGALLRHKADGSMIELVEWLTPNDREAPYSLPINHLGIHRMNWASTDLEADVAKLKARGVEFLTDIAPCCTGETSTFGIIVFADPDGTFNQLMGNLKPK